VSVEKDSASANVLNVRTRARLPARRSTFWLMLNCGLPDWPRLW